MKGWKDLIIGFGNLFDQFAKNNNI